MARKRKAAATEPAQEPEPVQNTEPEPKPAEEPEQPPAEDEEPMEADEGEENEADDGEEAEEDEEDNQNDGDSAETEQQQENPQIANPKPNTVTINGADEAEEDEEPIEKLLEPISKDQLTLLIKKAVAKHPNLIEELHELVDTDPAHCKIFIHGLGWEANTETITNVFGKYGEIEDCKVVKDKNTGKSKGYGFILYKNRLGAKRALKEPQKMIDGRMASCQLASAGPVQNPPQQHQQQNVVASVSAPPVSEYTQRKIYVSNVSADLDTKKLFEFFSKFGEIEEGPLGLDKQTGKPRGFCLFVYKSVESAKRALDEPHKSFEGHTLHCQKAVDGPKHSKGVFNQAHAQAQPQSKPQQQQGYYGHSAKKGRFMGSSGVGHTGGHLMAPSGPPVPPSVGFNPAVAPAALGQAVAALLATQGAGLGIGNLLGGIGSGVNPQSMMGNAGYGAQAGPYIGQPGLQGGYGGQPQMGQGGVRPHQGGGGPYMGHGL